MTTEPVVPPRPFHFGPVFASMVVPGFGQLLQKRLGAAFGHFFLFLLAAIAVYSLHYFVVLSAVLAVFSAVDAAVWNGEGEELSPMDTPITRLVPVILFCLLVALLIPAVQYAREEARRSQCVCHLKGIGLAFHNYHDTHGTLPPAYTVDENGKPLHSWRVLILPFLESHYLYEKIRLDEPWDSEYNRQFHDQGFYYYPCPSGSAVDGIYKKYPDLKKGNCCYSIVIGPETLFPGAEAMKLSDCTDGTGNTLLVVERMTPICWMDPNNEITFDTACEGVNRNLLGIGSGHQLGGANCVLMDGVCRYLYNGADLKPFLTKSGGENVSWEMLRGK